MSGSLTIRHYTDVQFTLLTSLHTASVICATCYTTTCLAIIHLLCDLHNYLHLLMAWTAVKNNQIKASKLLKNMVTVSLVGTFTQQLFSISLILLVSPKLIYTTVTNFCDQSTSANQWGGRMGSCKVNLLKYISCESSVIRLEITAANFWMNFPWFLYVAVLFHGTALLNI